MVLEEKVLELLMKNKGSYVSGSELARRLNVSRMAINKIISNLKRKGFTIEAHPHLGYRYVEFDDLKYLGSFINDLRTKVRYKVLYFEQVTSTQDIAHSLVSSYVEEGTIIVAEVQTKGRGRRERYWFSPKGGLWFTLILRPRVPPVKVTLLSLLAGCAVARAISEVTNLKVSLKWPNDVLINGKKVCGILVETIAEADYIKYAFLGIGINVNNEIPKELEKTATSLHKILGRRVSRVTLMRSFLIKFDEFYDDFKNYNFDKIIRVWKALSETLGKSVVIYLDDNRKIRGVAIDIDNNGALLVKTSNKILKIYSGDIIHLR